MILESDASLPREIFLGTLELIIGPVWVLTWRIPIIYVYAKALTSVDVTGNDRAVAAKDKFIPLPNGLGEVFSRSNAVIKGAIQLTRWQFAVSFLLEPFIVH